MNPADCMSDGGHRWSDPEPVDDAGRKLYLRRCDDCGARQEGVSQPPIRWTFVNRVRA